MTYKLTFLQSAKKEWDKLSPEIKNQFKKKLLQRLSIPKIQKDKLSSLPDCYKIKLRSIGYRLVYKVIESRVVIQVVAVGRREKNAVYKLAHKRIPKD